MTDFSQNHGGTNQVNFAAPSILQQNLLELIKHVEKKGAAEWVFSLQHPLPVDFNSRVAEKANLSCAIKLFGQKSISGGMHYFLSFKLQGSVEVPCQRCLENFMHPVTIENTLECYLSETRFQALSIEDEEYDSILVKADLTLLSVLEDEIILAIPAFAKHLKCLPKQSSTEIQFLEGLQEDDDEPIETRRPFANLADLMRDAKNISPATKKDKKK